MSEQTNDKDKPNEEQIKKVTFDVENEKKVNSLNELTIGDHVIIAFNESIYCHCIVENINFEKESLQIIYYDDAKFKSGIDEYIESNNTTATSTIDKLKSKFRLKPKRKPGVKQIELNFDKTKFDLYKVIYDESKEKCLQPTQTISKALEMLGKKKYNVFENNDEHFAIYCKTGKAGKLFILDPNDVKTKEIFGGSISGKVAGDLAKAGTNIVLVNTAKHIATRFPRSVAAASLPAVAEAAGSVIGIGLEGISMTYDIHKKYKQNKEGKISTIKFKKYIARRVTRGTVGVAGGIGGAVVGQMVIPVPVLGALVGGFVGGLLGSAVGYGQGILIGELVEKIDTKVKENKDAKINEPKNSEYQAVHKLVFQFGEDNANESNENLLQSEKNEKSEDEAEVIANLDEIINQEDYDVYVISNINENFVKSAPIDKDLSSSNENIVDIPLDFNVYLSLPKNE